MPTFRDLIVTAAPGGTDDRILLVQTGFPAGGSKVTIWVVPIDGTPATRVVSYTRTQSVYTDYDFVSLTRQLAPDGRRLVLSDADDAVGSGLIVVDLVAGAARRIQLSGVSNQPAWSPDGQRIAFRAATISGALAKDAGVWIVSASGGDARQLAATENADGATEIFGWTHDGAGVIYGSRAKLNVADVATGSVKQIGGAVAGASPIAVRQKQPSTAVVFDGGSSSTITGQVEVRDTASGPGTIVARYGAAEGTFLSDPTWRPGSDDLLLFWAAGQGLRERDELVVVDAVTGRRRTMPTPGPVRTASWTTDGGQVAYAGFAEARIRNADGSNDRVLFRPTNAANETTFVTRIAPFAPR